LALLMLGATACGEAAPSGTDTTAADGGDTTTAAPTGYDYGDHDFGGYEFKVLNFEEYCNVYMKLDLDEQSGEALDDAVFKRNSKVEEALNFKIKEVKEPYTGWNIAQIGLVDKVTQSVLAGDYAYDAAYLPVCFKPGIITDGYLLDLNELPGLHLDGEYWDSVLNSSLTLDGKLFAASGPLQFCTLEFSDVLLFNENMFTNYKLEFPYQLVRDGKWTLDEFYKYVSACTQLNGDESFAFKEGGSAVWGIAGHHDLPYALSYGAGCYLVKTEGDSFKLGIEDERFFNASETIAKIFTTSDGHVLWGAAEAEPSGYTNVFRADRGAFITCELKSAVVLRDMKSTFGLLPMPKYDAQQKNYQTAVSYNSTFLTVPKTQNDPERTGVILDALTYESYHDVLPIYYDVMVSQKGLRNEDSIEMLDIIYNTRGIEFTNIFGITNSFVSSYNSQIKSESLSLASLAASAKEGINANIEKVLTAIREQ
ncbi:MAG: hypothetical protein J6C52_01860, partial [Clostridia bacterium]|nr:hypothetical protein [Clostridia bacterium]